MELLQLKYFQVLARQEHMTKTAELLNISQPALSITIARLEAEIGVPLFNRKGRNIEINQFGKTFLEHVNQIFIELKSAKLEMHELTKKRNNQILLAATSTRFLSGLLRDFLEIYPEAKFHQSVSSVERIKEHLKAGELDFCLCSQPIQGIGIECDILLEDEILLCVSKTHRYADRSSIRLEEVANDPFISLEPRFSFRKIADNLCHLAGFTPNSIFEGDYQLVFELLGMGRGVNLIPNSAIHLYDRSSVTFLKIEAPLCQRVIGLSRLKRGHYSELSKKFRSFVIDYYKTKFSFQ